MNINKTWVSMCVGMCLYGLAFEVGIAAAPAKLSYEFVDLTDDFAALAERTAASTAADRVAAFKTGLIPLLPDFYGRQRFPKLSDAAFDARIAKSFDGFGEIRERYNAKSAAFQRMLEPALQDFRQQFPRLRSLPPIYLIHSLGEMDGGTRTLNGKLVLVFGADVMARHEFSDERPFLHHELFHVYHQQFFAGCEQVWCSLWAEGLAVFIAQQLNPSATDEQLLLAVPEPIRAQVDAHLADVVCTVRNRFSSEDEADLDALFSFGRLNSITPPRAGYYVGYLVAQRIRTRYSLDAMARLPTKEASGAVSKALEEMAACP